MRYIKQYLHNQEVWIVDIELNRTEQVLHSGVVGIAAINEIFIPATNNNLECKRKTRFS